MKTKSHLSQRARQIINATRNSSKISRPTVFFMTEDGQKSTDLYIDPKKKYGERCVVPKKPLSAYLFYTTKNVNLLKEKEGCTHPEAMKKCGELWNKLTPEERKEYEDSHEKDVLRY